MALHFGTVSLASLPANLLAAPAVAPIMWLGMLSGAVAQISPALAAPLNALDAPLLGFLTAVARTAAGVPYASVPVRLGSPAALAVAFAAPLALAAAVRAAERRLPPAGLGRRALGLRPAPLAAALGCVAVVAVLGWRHTHPGFRAGPGELAVSFLDVGQGDATLIQDGDGTAVLFDGGPPEAGVQRALRAAGVRRLDLVVATHQSRDHQGGLHAVLARFPTRLLLENGDGTRDPDFRRLLAEADAAGSAASPPARARCCRSAARGARARAGAATARRARRPRIRTRAASPRIVSAGDVRRLAVRRRRERRDPAAALPRSRR
jgi:competence protein ComEC